MGEFYKKKTTEDFIIESQRVHGEKYDYSKVSYEGAHKKVCIICPIHGEFWQSPTLHLRGSGCSRCVNENKHPNQYTTETFIKKIKEVHGNKYDCSKVVYKGSKEKVCLICPEHGEFWIRANHIPQGKGCHQCAKEFADKKRNKGTECFIKEAKQVHKDKYDYSKTVYVNSRTNVCIICPEHGEFWQKASNHLSGSGCPLCSRKESGINRRMTTEGFIIKSKQVHNEKYNYSKVKYEHSNTKVCIVCPKHGEFWQTPSAHLSGEGCPECAKEYNGNLHRKKEENVIKRFEMAHGDDYDYSLVKYEHINKKVAIICHKKDEDGNEHGIFYQTPHNHMKGCCCPKCQESVLEHLTRKALEKHGVKYEQWKTFEWLKRNDKGKMSLDFYLPDIRKAIECQGEQHFTPVYIWDGNKGLIDQKERDKIKKELCEQNNIEMNYIMPKDNYKIIEKKVKQIINATE